MFTLAPAVTLCLYAALFYFIFVCAMCEVSNTDSPVCVDDSRCMLEVGGEFRVVSVCMFTWGGGWGRLHEKTYMC